MLNDNGRNNTKLPKILVILGPTASGKTAMSLSLAKKYNGEIVNADSRQVYRAMNIGTAKPTGEIKYNITGCEPAIANIKNSEIFVVSGIPHHLMDIVDPDESFAVSDFKERAIVAISDILNRGKLPIIVGGTGLYIQSIVDNLQIPRVAPDNDLRVELEKKTLDEQVAMLKKIDPESAQTIDLKNPRRVLRALEVATASGESFVKQQTKGEPMYDALEIGIEWPREELYARINIRVDTQMAEGLLEETRGLLDKLKDSSSALQNDNGPWVLPSMSGIGYKQMGYFLRGEISLPEAIEILKRDTRRYSKRQMTWFKRDPRIVWVKNIDDAEKEVEKFLN